MSSLLIPDLALLRRWLDQLAITFFECDICQALHLSHMQNVDSIVDAKIDILDETVLFTVSAEVRPSCLLALGAELSQMNASILGVKVFIDIQDDNTPKLVACMMLNASVGICFEQFAAFMQQGEEQLSMMIMEASAQGMLLLEEMEENDEYQSTVSTERGSMLH